MKHLLLVFTAIIIIFSISTSSLAASFVITGDYVNVRSLPLIDENNVIGQLHYGNIIEIYDFYENWYSINYNNTLGYVSADYVSTDFSGIAGLTKGRLNLRLAPNKNSYSLIIIPENAVIKVLDTSSKWYQVEYNGLIGYAHSDYITLKRIKNEELLGCYTTFFSTSSTQKGRVKNIEKSADLIDNCIIQPDSSFSLLNTIGPITKKNGYYQAAEYKQTEHGTQTVLGYGGGVCQLATTLYQSICQAKSSISNITITERHNHSKSVSYIEKGKDATISWNSNMDFSFKNNNNYTLKIRTFVNDGSLSCMIYRQLNEQ